jgi:Methyltransferase domain
MEPAARGLVSTFMYPFWESVIAPMLKISGGQRVVEVGALRGETTVKMLDDLGPESEVHVIDPVPAFDPGEHEAKFPGRYVFHRDLSVNVLEALPAFDIALIDGDHNWYTVYNEMRQLAAASRRDGKSLPLSILHDVCWPYGRRDLYYEPSNIPEEHRQPYEYRGMRPGRAELLTNGGMNITLANAVTEGGERNGVMTGLEDFMAEHDRPLRCVVLPIYFGLAIVAEVAMLEAQPALAEFLDHLESPAGVRELLELSEAIRLDGVVFEHNIERVKNDRLARAIDRHLRVLRESLDVSDAEADRFDAALQPLVNGGIVGDIVHSGSDAGLRYVAGFLDAYEVTNRVIWTIGADPGGLGDRVHILNLHEADAASSPPVALLSVGPHGDEATLRNALGTRLAPDVVVVG